MADDKNFKTIMLGDMLLNTDKESGNAKTYKVFKSKDDPEDFEEVQTFSLKVYIPEAVDEAGIGEPSIVLKRGQYINFRCFSQSEIEEMPGWKKEVAQLKAYIATDRKVYKKQS